MKNNNKKLENAKEKQRKKTTMKPGIYGRGLGGIPEEEERPGEVFCFTFTVVEQMERAP